MKTVKALKNYIYSPYSRNKGETVTVPDAIGEHLVLIGFAEYVEEDPIAEDPIEEDPIAEDPIEEDPIEEDPIAEDPIEEVPIEEESVEDPGDQVSRKPEKTNGSARKRSKK